MIQTETTVGPQSLARSLRVLEELLACAGPASATELSGRVGLHPSSVSRILSTLQKVGFVRKPDYHHFAADFGLLTLAGRAIHQFPLIHKTLPVMRRLGPLCDPLRPTLATLWRREVLYLLRGGAATARREFAEVDVMPLTRYPLHLSSPGLRLLLEAPRREALASLEESRREFGWTRPTSLVPGSPAQVLRLARESLELDVLALVGWQREGQVTAAIPIREGGQTVAALALSGELGDISLDRVRSLLHHGAKEIETALQKPNAQAK